MQVQDVPANHGWQWIRRGFALFRKSPMMWGAIVALWFVLMVILLAILRGFGLIVASILYPVFLAGVLVACEQIDRDGRLDPANLFAGFRQNLSQLLILGIVVFLAQLALSLVAALIVPLDDEVANLLQKLPDISEDEAQQVLPKLLVFAAVQLAVKAPVFMAVWFAPPLIIFENVKAFPAVRWSVYACVANIGAVVVYALISAALLIVVAALPVLLAVPAIIALAPTLLASVYTAYRDIFVAEPALRPES